VAAATHVVKVPNGALRYKPDLSAQEVAALYQKYGIPEGAGPHARPMPAAADTAKAAARPQNTASGRPASASNEAPATPEGQPARYDTQVVWKLLPDKSLEPVRIRTGITDHTFTEVVQQVNGELSTGDELVTGVVQGRSSAPRPGGPGVPRGR
jgi:hypothetical protein